MKFSINRNINRNVKSFKFLFFLLFAALFQHNLIKAQTADSILISGNYRDKLLTEFFDDLENKYQVKFYFRIEWVRDIKFTRNFDKTPINKAIDQAIAETPFLFESVQNGIIIMPKEAVAIATGKMEILSSKIQLDDLITVGNINEGGKSRKAVLKGTVTSVKDNNPVVGAEIHAENTRLGTISGADGQFSIELPTGILNLVINSIGFEEHIVSIKLLSSGNIEIQLPEKSIKIDEVVISAQRADRNVSSNQMSIVELDRKQIKQLPSVYGTKDILKNMTMVAGVKSVGEFGADLNVRGGGGDQNLYMIEGTPVFNSAHVFGLTSVINSDIIDNLVLHKGDIPARFGERISSILDMNVTKEVPSKLKGTGGIGLIDSRLAIEAPIIKNKLSFMVSGRYNYSDWLLNKIPDADIRNSKASFYDVSSMLYWNVNQKNKMSAFFYASYDYFDYASELNYSYANILGSYSWQHRFNPFLNSVLSFSLSHYEVEKNDTEIAFTASSAFSDLNYKSAKLNFEFIKFNNHFIEWGVQSVFYKLNPGKLSPADTISSIVPVQIMAEKANESAIYISDNYDISKKVSIGAGLRFSAFAKFGSATIYNYEPDAPLSEETIIDSTIYGNNEVVNTYFGIEPRFSFKYQLNESSALKFNYNRNFQYISLISYTSVFTPDDRWKLCDPFLKPVNCNQFAMGYFKNFKQNTIVTSVEVYYKKINNLVEYKNGAKISMNPHVETELIPATGTNYGIELSFKKSSRNFDFWMNYTWSRSLKKTSGTYDEEMVNNNSLYPSNYDKPNELNLLLNYHINRRIRFTANFVYSSGRPATLPEMKYLINGDWAIYYSDRNKYRLPDYHRLDLAITFDESLKKSKKWKSSLTISIINIYGRNNAYSVFYKKEEPGIKNDFNAFPLYKLYIIGNPVPTITYNFIF
ncbi:MAG: TonB-dependent receptor [Bacteroidales bacterium]